MFRIFFSGGLQQTYLSQIGVNYNEKLETVLGSSSNGYFHVFLAAFITFVVLLYLRLSRQNQLTNS